MQIADLDWDEVEQYYAQYSPQELEVMCRPKRCRTCDESEQCNTALAHSRLDFMLSLGRGESS